MKVEMFRVKEDELALYGQSWEKIGKSAGVHIAAQYLLEQCGKRFSEGKGEEARIFREAATLLGQFVNKDRALVMNMEARQREIWRTVFDRPPVQTG